MREYHSSAYKNCEPMKKKHFIVKTTEKNQHAKILELKNKLAKTKQTETAVRTLIISFPSQTNFAYGKANPQL